MTISCSVGHLIRGVSVYVELSQRPEITKGLFRALAELISRLDHVQELLLLFDSNVAVPSWIWLEADVTAPLAAVLRTKTTLRTLVLQNSRVSTRLLFPNPVRLAGGVELISAAPNLECLSMNGVSPLLESLNNDWQFQASLGRILNRIKRVDFNFPL